MSDFQEMAKEHMALVEKIEMILRGQKLDNVVPTLASFLAEAGYMTGMDKKEFSTFVVGAIDRMYLAAEKAEQDPQGGMQ